MKEYLVHIEIEDKDKSHELIFRSSTLTVLFLAIDDFRKATSIVTDAESILESLSKNFESEFTTVDDKDQFDEEDKSSPTTNNKQTTNDNDDNEHEEDQFFPSRVRQDPQLKISFPGAA